MNALLQQLLARATTPLVPQVGQAADSAAQAMTTPKLDESPMMAKLKGFGAGALQGAGHLISDQTSPLNLALMATSMPKLGSLGKIGIAKTPALAPAAETLGELNPMFTPVGGEGMFNLGKKTLAKVTDPAEAAYHRLLANGGR